MRHGLFTWLAIAALAALAGCGVVPEKPIPAKHLPPPKPPRVAFNTLIDSEPRGVRCNVTGESGRTMTVTTPRLVALYRLGDPVRLRCFAEGYWTVEHGILEGTARALLIRLSDGEQVTPAHAPVRGGEVGRGGEFPRAVTVTLRLNAFDGAEARDAYYAQQLHEAAAGWDTLAKRANVECKYGDVPQDGRSKVSLPDLCRDGLRLLEELKRTDLQEIEQQRRRSTIP